MRKGRPLDAEATPVRLFGFLLFALAVLASAGQSRAHPHIWIKATATLQFEANKVVGILHEWTFDDFFSGALITDFDKNGDKKFDAAEAKALHDNAFIALKAFGYFTHVRVNGKAAPIQETRDFVPAIRDGKVVYRFVTVLPAPVDPRADKLDASVYDESYYVDVDVNPRISVKLAGAGAEGCSYTVYSDKDSPLYFGAVFVQRIELRCGKP